MIEEKSRIRNADPRDLPVILTIYAKARSFMAQNGNPTQWTDGYPGEELLLNAAEAGKLYVLEEKDEIHGVFFFDIGPDATYNVIKDGAWLSDSRYGVIHLVAGDGTVHGFLGRIAEFCGRQISHLRIDTHEDNHIMQHVIEKQGFSRRGIIYTDNGSPRIAYEKL